MRNKNCKRDEHRPCELATAVNFARDMSEEYGTPIPPKLQRILDTQRVSETQVSAALQEWRDTIPRNRRADADELIDIAFPREGR